MALNSSIEWTEATWNPVTGCTEISSGCKNCYAKRMALRLQAMGSANYKAGFRVTVHPHLLSTPLRWRKPRTVFVNSMSDLFHADVCESFIAQVFETMCQTPQHTYQVLTKRSARLRDVSPRLPWPHNVWMGVTVENSAHLSRIDDLRRTPARVKFLSLEPLLGPIAELDLAGIDWVIVGGESGPKARPMSSEWVEGILHQCQAAGVPFFFKQWGGTNKKRTGRVLGGRTWNQMPQLSSV
jgi:protein gp37